MSEKYKVFDTDSAYVITFTLVEWHNLFQIPQFAQILIDSIKYCQHNKGLELFGYCIMPSHVHLIARSEIYPLGSVVRDLKKYTASMIVKKLIEDQAYKSILDSFAIKAKNINRNWNYKVWQDGFHPEIITSNRFFYQKLKYIHDNPVEAELVSSPEMYIYSSARNYAKLGSVLEIIFESSQLITYR